MASSLFVLIRAVSQRLESGTRHPEQSIGKPEAGLHRFMLTFVPSCPCGEFFLPVSESQPSVGTLPRHQESDYHQVRHIEEHTHRERRRIKPEMVVERPRQPAP